MELNKEQVLNRLRARITYDFKIKDLANEFGVSAAFMSMVLGGKREMTGPMLDAIGVERHVYYTELPKTSK